MKRLLLISAIAMSGILYNTADAQIRFHAGIRFDLPRVAVAVQAPVVYNEPVNYDGDEDYYYLPDVDAYYSVPDQCYYYNDGGAWVSASYLPGAYRDYDWRSVRHYEVRAPRPYKHDDFYRAKFNGAVFAGRWDDRRYDNRVNTYYHPMEYNRDHDGYDRYDNFRNRGSYEHNDDFRERGNYERHGDFRDRGRFENDNFRHGRS
ncbi:MAG: hypothetical protein JSU01_06805 [Bacteroidetes bacterium]|nr:hypothetical protein [Bacteroidota bacterium]